MCTWPRAHTTRRVSSLLPVLRSETQAQLSARGRRGTTVSLDHPPGDVDLVVMGEPDRDAVIENVDEASRLLGRDVQVVFRSRGRWEAAMDALTRSVQERPTVELDLAEEPRS